MDDKFEFDDDEFSGIFDNLNPNDFSGVASTPVRYEAFEDFVDHNVRSVRVAFLAVDGNQLNPIAILQTEDTEWMYAPEDDETMGEYLERLRGEARRLNAIRFFISRTTKVGVLPADVDVDAADPVTAQDMLAKDKLTDGVLFFAMERAGNTIATTHGIMVAYANRLGEAQRGDDDQTVALFARILDPTLP